MKNFYSAAAVFATLTLFSYYVWSDRTSDTDLASNRAAVTAPTPNAQDALNVPNQLSQANLRSPFGKGAPPPPRSMEQRIKSRQARMEQNHYMTPPEYFKMSLRELNERASKKDVFALLQLGEQYWKESDELVDDPAYDHSASPRQNAAKFMIEAVAQGHSHAATVVSAIYEDQGQELEAYAWTLVSQSVMDRSLDEKAASYEQKFTKEQRDAAEVIAAKEQAKIYKAMFARFKNT